MASEKPTMSACRNAKRDPATHQVIEPCPYKGMAPVFKVVGVRVLTLCDGCQEDLATEEAREEMARRERELEQLKDGPRDRSWSFATYPQDAEGKRVAKEAQEWTRKWLEANEPWDEWDENGDPLPAPLRPESPGNLIVVGPVGTGKTGLVWCITRELVLAGHRVRFVNWRNLLYDLRESFGANGQRDSLDRYIAAPALVLDDVGAERVTEWAAEQLATLIDSRYMKGRVTVVTSNYGANELADRLSVEDAVIGDRIMSRLLEGASVIKVEGSDRRRMAA